MKYFLASIGLLAVLIGLLAWPDGKTDRLVVHCAAALRLPLEAIAHEYEKTHGVALEPEYGGSPTLLANIELTKRGDLYLPADDYYIELAQKKNLLDEVIPVAVMTPVVAVKKGNPKKILSLADLSNGDVRLALANPEAAAIGKLSRDALSAAQWQALSQNARVFTLTVTDVANNIALGAVDAGIVWDTTVRQYPNLEMISTPELSGQRAHVKIGLLKCSTRSAEALCFARFLASSELGTAEFKRAGFEPAAK